MQDILMPERALSPVELDRELAKLARLYAAADGPGMRMLSFLGLRADQLMNRLPDPVLERLDGASAQALQFALRQGGGRLPLRSDRGNRMIGAALGAVGGAGGVAGTLAELPVTTSFLLRLIQREAVAQGFDPKSDSVAFDTVQVFASSGPLAAEQRGYLATRIGLSSGGLPKLVAQVAPKLGVALGQKLAAQSVPVLGGVAGASCNYVYAQYYQNIAKVNFGVRRLALNCDISELELSERLQQQLKRADP